LRKSAELNGESVDVYGKNLVVVISSFLEYGFEPDKGL
jgi:hypothetical protein